jgi:hypothetical protein
VVVEINALCFAFGARPPKDKAPLLVDTDGMKSRKITSEFLKMITGRHPQVLISRRIVEHLKLAKQTVFKVGRDIPGSHVFREKSAQPFVTEAYDHRIRP